MMGLVRVSFRILADVLLMLVPGRRGNVGCQSYRGHLKSNIGLATFLLMETLEDGGGPHFGRLCCAHGGLFEFGWAS